jgi:hypothetical protein
MWRWYSVAGRQYRVNRYCRYFEELNGLLFYPVQYEGEEMSPNVFYTGAAPNQQAIPAVEYLMMKMVAAAQTFLPVGYRLRLPTNHQQDPARFPAFERG